MLFHVCSTLFYTVKKIRVWGTLLHALGAMHDETRWLCGLYEQRIGGSDRL